MACTDRQKLVGKRMRESAEAKDLGAYQMADLMGCEPPTIYRWWKGEQWPGLDVLERYAEVTEQEFGWFFEREGEGWQARSAAAIMDILERVIAGDRPSIAYDMVVGSEAELSQRERRLVDAGAEGVRQFVREVAKSDWDQVSAARRRHVLVSIVEESLRRLEP